ncbi:MAG: hypothetical protein LBQ06_04455 [Frankiaceae bacterium]|jgi:hypothetical protein|nr:hypothetical protein [Frankiaceae bacterium]
MRAGPIGRAARLTAGRVRGDAATRASLVAVAAAALLIGSYLLAPLMGGDLSAQMARAEFARDHPLALIDLRWFGGVQPFGYTLWVTFAMALVGPRAVGALAALASTILTARLFLRAGARRPAWGAAAAALCQASDLAEGRVTFACGMAFGLGALLALPAMPPRPGAERDPGRRRGRLAAAGALAAVCGAASPVAAMLLWLCAAVLMTRRRAAEALVLALCSAIPTAVLVVVFADGGPQPFSTMDALRATAATAFAGLVVARRHRMVRIGAALGVAMVLLAWALPTPVGGNAMRLSLLFAVPAVIALADVRARWAAGLLAVAVVLQTPVTWGTLAGAGAPQTEMAYYRPMIDAIRAGAPLAGRVQIPELNGHWEAVYAARELPLARGWLRQTDTKLNSDPFYGHPLNAQTYRRWLDLNGVQYVAVSNARLTGTGRRERDFIRNERPGYLSAAWSNPDWTLYAVSGFTPVADAPATVLSQGATAVVIEVPAGAEVTVRIRPFRWLRMGGANGQALPAGACLTPGDRWITVRGGSGGPIQIGSDLRIAGGAPRC